MVEAQAHRHGDALEVHADQGAADVESGVRADLLEHNRVVKGAVGGGGKGAACLGLRHHADLLGVRHSGTLHANGAVEVLAALRREINSLFLQDLVNTAENRFGCLQAGIVSDHAAGYLTGRAADDQNIAFFQVRGGDKLLRCLLCLLKQFVLHVIISCGYYSRIAAKLQACRPNKNLLKKVFEKLHGCMQFFRFFRV